jgi:hypothetical protein
MCMHMQAAAAAQNLARADQRELQAKLKELVRHIRENKLRITFTDALGQAQEESNGVNSQKEARRLAFYLFWNVRASYERCRPETLDYQIMMSRPERRGICSNSDFPKGLAQAMRPKPSGWRSTLAGMCSPAMTGVTDVY